MLGSVFNPLEELQDGIQSLIDKARNSEDKTMMDGIIASEYPDHVVVSTVLAMHYATDNQDPISEKNIFDAILFLDRLDTMNLKVVGK